MNFLLDTHAFLWWITNNPRLSLRAAASLRDLGNTIYFSVASAWEIAIKARLGKLSLVTAAEQFDGFIEDQLTRNRMIVLPVQLRHALRVYSLPGYHNDRPI